MCIFNNNNNNMKGKIASSVADNGVDLENNTLHSDLTDIMSAHKATIQKEYGEESFHRLFWNQQLEVLATSPTQRRWHPMLISENALPSSI